MKTNQKVFAVVAITVLLQVLSAALLKQAALTSRAALLLTLVFIGGAFTVQLMRFLLWGYAHRRWPLSTTYPMTALFFPVVLLLSLWYGEPVHSHEAIGALLITAGVAWLVFKKTE